MNKRPLVKLKNKKKAMSILLSRLLCQYLSISHIRQAIFVN